MSDIKEILLRHYNTYPKMQIQDMVKLIYQNEFAGGHFIDSEPECRKRLQAEIDEIISSRLGSESPLFEDIGNGLVRLYLHRISEFKISIATINRFFMNTSNSIRGNAESFERKVNIMKKCCEDGLLPFKKDEVEVFVEALKEKGYPPVSHSEEYRKAYNPHYRVIRAEYGTFLMCF
ncbi:hypothetical protein ODU73_001636 [Thermoclostridium stercorarium]|uniref:hypothetical protein n=1 Tax=Thermoclostridium stercorarium TaxID=1510 RepID=UPI0022488F6C|nr:hypothetical protein [Thermoclostridium stercorarium]UZQ84603.1 hypothetical protein ODU73_001636 [Thermoclostridium stercorarium]